MVNVTGDNNGTSYNRIPKPEDDKSPPLKVGAQEFGPTARLHGLIYEHNGAMRVRMANSDKTFPLRRNGDLN